MKLIDTDGLYVADRVLDIRELDVESDKQQNIWLVESREALYIHP
jgi:hypothetical protein